MAKSFYEVLEEQIRSEVRKELEFEWAQSQRAAKAKPEAKPQPTRLSAEASLQTWLWTKVEKTVFTDAQRAKKAYASHRETQPRPEEQPTPQAKLPPMAAQISSPEAAFAAEILSRFSGTQLPELFTLGDLKTVWRRAALKTHPDRLQQSDAVSQSRATALFRELSSAHDLLESLF